MTDYVAEAERVLEMRARAFEQLKAVQADTSLSEADRGQRAARINGEIDELGQEAERYVRAAELEAEHRALNAHAGRLAAAGARRTRDSDSDSGMEWRALLPNRTELRALKESDNADGGYTVPTRVSGRYIDLLRRRSVVLRAPGINVLPLTSNVLRLPQLVASSGVAGPTPEATTIPEGDTEWQGPELRAYGYKTIHRASNEILMDSALELRSILADTMTRDIATRIDLDSFGAATGRITGFTAAGNHTKVALASGSTTVAWDDVVGAVADIEADGGAATVVFANGAMAKALRLERENGTTGAYLQGTVTGNPARTAQGLPIFASNNVPARSVIVADMSRVFFGIRSTKLDISDDAYFDTDEVGFRLVHRAAGLIVAEPDSVIWIEAAAS
ncbi:phage major capsid protein [Plantactinospora sp. BB1]|uniref:phage major capsid protein n=1 Tax=Plantactinospora sp. BB1 TaxID=2071627 RepID=UPI000D17AD1D|nr:phage major capsid protein [Plantactinospora sp. BB1]AVT39389.1 phage major capsid protein [Plantactinospora sp. BB1]